MNLPDIILASESPYRKSLMEQLGLPFTATKPLVDEEEVKKSLTVANNLLARALAKSKAESLIKTNPQSLIIGSDQVLILEGKVLNKPHSKEEVLERLHQLQGRQHELHTAIAVYYNGQWFEETVVAKLKMRALSPEDIETYYSMDPAIGCAGGYKLENKGPLLLESIQTEDHFSIIGLPLFSLVKILHGLGFSPLSSSS